MIRPSTKVIEYKPKSTASSSSYIQRAEEKEGYSSDESWYIFLDSYLKFNLYACEHLLKNRNLTLYNKRLLIPILYNLKHAIEIFLKALSKTINKDSDVEKNHDVKKLFNDFKKSLDKKLKSKPKRGISLKNSASKLEKIVLKYYHLDCVMSHIKDIIVPEDSENSFFKYPENSVSFKVNDYNKLFNNYVEADFTGIKMDIEDIIRLVAKMKNLIK